MTVVLFYFVNPTHHIESLYDAIDPQFLPSDAVWRYYCALFTAQETKQPTQLQHWINHTLYLTISQPKLS